MEPSYHIERRPRYSNIKLCIYSIILIVYIVMSTIILATPPTAYLNFWYYNICLAIYTGLLLLIIPLSFIYNELKKKLKYSLPIIYVIYSIILCNFNDNTFNFYNKNYINMLVLCIINLIGNGFGTMYFVLTKTDEHHQYVSIEV